MTGMRPDSEGIFKIIGNALTGQGESVPRADRLAFTEHALTQPFYRAYDAAVNLFLVTGQVMLTHVNHPSRGMEALLNCEVNTLDAAVRAHFTKIVCPVRFDEGRAVHNPYPDNALA